MPNAPRFARVALLVTGSAMLAGLAATWATPRYAGARVPPAAELPWPPGARTEDRVLPFALLYVDSHCVHCSRAAVLVDSVATANDLHVVIASRDTPADADAYRHRLGLHHALIRDASAALIHAVGTGSVPTLVIFHRDGSRQLLVGYTHDAQYRSALTELTR